MMQVTIPDGLGPGSVFSVFQPDGQQVQIQVPEGGKPGMAMEVAVQPPLHTNPVVYAEAVSVNVQSNPVVCAQAAPVCGQPVQQQGPIGSNVQVNGQTVPQLYGAHVPQQRTGCCPTWHATVLNVCFGTFLFNMGAPFWIEISDFEELYYGPWGYYYDGEYTEFSDLDADLEVWRFGTTVAFLFSLFAVIAKYRAWKSEPHVKSQLTSSAVLTIVACLGACISWIKAASEEGDAYLCFGLQLIASFALIPSIVMDFKAKCLASM
jgi:hypothetical protein